MGLKAKTPLWMMKYVLDGVVQNVGIYFIIASIAGLKTPNLWMEHVFVWLHILPLKDYFQLVGLQNYGLCQYFG